jgi:predicted site-specific integrase-resolvase
MSNTNLLLKRLEVARLLRVTSRTIRNYELSGKLHPVRLNQRVLRYKAADVQRLIEPATVEKKEVAS